MPDPLYRRIADDLERLIESGRYSPGAQLPTEVELVRQYSAARNTVRDAIRWLTKRGLVQTWPGQGTFVRERIEPFTTTLSPDPETGLSSGESPVYEREVRAQGREPFATVPKVQLVPAIGVVAAGLQLAEGTTVVSREQERFIDGRPYSIQTSYFPMSLVTSGAEGLLTVEEIASGAVVYLQETLGLRPARYEDRLRVRIPRKGEARFFRLPDGGVVSVWETIRIALDDDGSPFRVTVTVFAADRNRLAFYSGDVPDRARVATLRRMSEERSDA